MAKLSELGGGAVGSLAIAVLYGAAFSLAYPLQPVDSSLAVLFAIFGLVTYLAIRVIVKLLSNRRSDGSQ